MTASRTLKSRRISSKKRNRPISRLRLVLSCLVLSVYWPPLLVESNGQGWVPVSCHLSLHFDIVCLRNGIEHALDLSISRMWTFHENDFVLVKSCEHSAPNTVSREWRWVSDVIDQNVTWQQTASRKHSWKHSAFRFIASDLHKVDKTALVIINGAVSMLTKVGHS